MKSQEIIFLKTPFCKQLLIVLDFYSQVEVERKTAEDKPSPQAKVSEVSETKAEEINPNEPSASAQVYSERTLLLTETKLSSLNKTNLLSFFQAQSQPINFLEAFQKHTLKKHLKCFRQMAEDQKA